MKTAQEVPKQEESPKKSGLGRVSAVAAFLDVSRTTVYRLIDHGDLPSVKIGNSRRVPWDAVEEMIDANTATA